MTVKGMKFSIVKSTGARGSVMSVLAAVIIAMVAAMPSGAIADTVELKAWGRGGTEQLCGTLTVTTTGPNGIPTTQTVQASGQPPKVSINLPPGTHILHFEGTNQAGNTEKGVMQYTVVAGAQHKVLMYTQEGPAKINPPPTA